MLWNDATPARDVTEQSFLLLCVQICVDIIVIGLKAEVLKVVDIDPQGPTGPSKGSINIHGVESGSLNDP